MQLEQQQEFSDRVLSLYRDRTKKVITIKNILRDEGFKFPNTKIIEIVKDAGAAQRGISCEFNKINTPKKRGQYVLYSKEHKTEWIDENGQKGTIIKQKLLSTGSFEYTVRF